MLDIHKGILLAFAESQQSVPLLSRYGENEMWSWHVQDIVSTSRAKAWKLANPERVRQHRERENARRRERRAASK